MENDSWSLSHPYTTPPNLRHINPVIVAHPAPFRRRFNLRKVDWNGFATELDKLIEDVEHTPVNYSRFVKEVRVASKRNIPRECRTSYRPGLSDEPKSLFEEYNAQYSIDPLGIETIETENAIMNNMKEEK